MAQTATTVIQEARASVMVGSFPQRMDGTATSLPSEESAEAALAFLAEMSPDLRAAAVLGPQGEVVAASGGGAGRWGRGWGGAGSRGRRRRRPLRRRRRRREGARRAGPHRHRAGGGLRDPQRR